LDAPASHSQNRLVGQAGELKPAPPNEVFRRAFLLDFRGCHGKYASIVPKNLKQ
jgi:hypothetical protein